MEAMGVSEADPVDPKEAEEMEMGMDQSVGDAYGLQYVH